jgi:hypothetical protein
MVLTDLNPANVLTDQDWPCGIDRTMLLKTNLISGHVFDQPISGHVLV